MLTDGPPGPERLRRWLVGRALRAALAAHGAAVWLAGKVGRARPADGEGLYVLLTGTFHADNWVRAHLEPLAASARCRRLVFVASTPLPPMAAVEAVYPPPPLVRVVGGVAARLLTFAWVAMRTRPQVVGGFHLLLNGLLAVLLARLCGARSLYLCVGGPREMLDGGIWAENRLFSKLRGPDRAVEQALLRAVRAFDVIVTMGTTARTFFLEQGVRAPIHVVPGGIAGPRFSAGEAPRTRDLVLVGRLAPVKRVDLFLRAVEQVKRVRPHVTATVVGDGPLRSELEALARQLGLAEVVRFAGHQPDVVPWLREARLFVLTSDSEGLALSVMEAMMCGLPAIVSAVGDLPDLVGDAVNGHLVTARLPEAFAQPIIALLEEPARLDRYARAAREAAMRVEIGVIARSWNRVLEFSARPVEGPA